MFDIGFWELILIGVMGLIILGPERMPQAIKTVSQLIRTVRGTANSIKEQVSQELKIEQLHADLKKAEKEGLDNIGPDLKASVDELRSAADFVNKPFDVSGTDADKSEPAQKSTPSTDKPD